MAAFIDTRSGKAHAGSADAPPAAVDDQNRPSDHTSSQSSPSPADPHSSRPRAQGPPPATAVEANDRFLIHAAAAFSPLLDLRLGPVLRLQPRQGRKVLISRDQH